MVKKFKNITKTKSKIYIHRTFLIKHPDFKFLKIRMSWDEEKLFIRSAKVLLSDQPYNEKWVTPEIILANDMEVHCDSY